MQLDEIDKITTHREKALECVDGEVDAEGNGFYQERTCFAAAAIDCVTDTLLLQFMSCCWPVTA